MTTKTIKQTVKFLASPEAVYKALMDSTLHTKFTGQAAKISNKVGGAFKAYGDYITGINKVLQPGKKIVQTWRASDWDKGHMSEVTFIFSKLKNGTKFAFTHKGVPVKNFKSIAWGWKQYYWHPMKLMLEKK